MGHWFIGPLSHPVIGSLRHLRFSSFEFRFSIFQFPVSPFCSPSRQMGSPSHRNPPITGAEKCFTRGSARRFCPRGCHPEWLGFARPLSFRLCLFLVTRHCSSDRLIGPLVIGDCRPQQMGSRSHRNPSITEAEDCVTEGSGCPEFCFQHRTKRVTKCSALPTRATSLSTASNPKRY